MDAEEFRQRTKRFALMILAIAAKLPDNNPGWVIGKQLISCGTSVGANYRSACKARSKRDFISKITISEEEADESQYWLELIRDGGLLPADMVEPALQEAKEITAMLTASGKTARRTLREN